MELRQRQSGIGGDWNKLEEFFNKLTSSTFEVRGISDDASRWARISDVLGQTASNKNKKEQWFEFERRVRSPNGKFCVYYSSIGVKRNEIKCFHAEGEGCSGWFRLKFAWDQTSIRAYPYTGTDSLVEFMERLLRMEIGDAKLFVETFFK